MGEMALAGGREGGRRGIARELNARGILPPSARKWSEEKLKERGRIEWSDTAVEKLMRDGIYSTGIWWYGKRKFVEPNKDRLRKPNAERHTARSLGVLRPREEWAGSIALPGGPIWTPDEHAAILEALERNGEAGRGKPARRRDDGGREAILKTLCVCGATVTEGEDAGKECARSVAPWHSSRKKDDGTRTLYYRCTHRHQSQGHHLCDGKSIRADLLEPAVWEGVKEAVCVELDRLIAEQYGQVTKAEDNDMLAKLRDERKRKEQYRKNAMRDKVEAATGEDREYYGSLMAQYTAEIALLDRRIQATTGEIEPEQLNIAAVERDAREAFDTDETEERGAILRDWIPRGGIRYAHGEAVITIRIQVGVKCEYDEHQIRNKHLLITKRIKVAA